jgi:hypothetical protein
MRLSSKAFRSALCSSQGAFFWICSLWEACSGESNSLYEFATSDVGLLYNIAVMCKHYCFLGMPRSEPPVTLGLLEAVYSDCSPGPSNAFQKVHYW